MSSRVEARWLVQCKLVCIVHISAPPGKPRSTKSSPTAMPAAGSRQQAEGDATRAACRPEPWEATRGPACSGLCLGTCGLRYFSSCFGLAHYRLPAGRLIPQSLRTTTTTITTSSSPRGVTYLKVSRSQKFYREILAMQVIIVKTFVARCLFYS
ncbi:hypothetical protein E2C01_010053 [Portunus trituberculatus]|uniref:Uncharacterized protein n=1 Tax=Portunus trituberculatus TaxID=210409 RepID=A0A5B7D7N7_PORTR|nr:hypothetical protein [Portunus trituberculatus]